VTVTPISRARAAAFTWGSTARERELPFACDELVPEPRDVLFRAITVNAPPSVLFRWLCQLRAAPYSYDWIDNLGRRSPPTLTAGLEYLRLGQRIMTVFRLAAFERDRHLTAVLAGGRPLFEELALTYLIVPVADGRCRLVVKIVVKYPRGPIGAAARALLPFGDLVMMRRQLRTFRDLAERDVTFVASRGS
jgi:hypothetical protein